MSDRWQGVDIPPVPIIRLKEWQTDVLELQKWIEGLCRGIAIILDEVKADIATGGAQLGSEMPSSIIVRVGSAGDSEYASHEDHEHPCDAIGVALSDASPMAEVADTVGDAGAGTEASRYDHKHALTCATPVALANGATSSEGVASTLARSDHIHGMGVDEPLRMSFQIREHDRFTDAAKMTTGLITTSPGALSIVSGPNAIGLYHVFKNFPRAYLHGKYVDWGWRLDMFADPSAPYTGAQAIYFRVYDGRYDRASATDFPIGLALALKGNGLLQALGSRDTDDGAIMQYESPVQLDLDGGSQDECCFMFTLEDGLIDVGGIMYIDYLNIRETSGGKILFTEDFREGAILNNEVTGTYSDYSAVTAGG